MDTATVKQAILAGAKLLEENPEGYEFYSNGIGRCAGKSCMIGFIGEATGFPKGTYNYEVGSHFGIYHLSDNVHDLIQFAYGRKDFGFNLENPQDAVTIMREFAEKFS